MNMIYKKSWKYILKHAFGSYYRPKALKNFKDVYKGDRGGYVKGYYNLSQTGNCWVYDEAIVSGDARVTEDAVIRHTAQIINDAKISGDAEVIGDRKVQHDLSQLKECWIYDI